MASDKPELKSLKICLELHEKVKAYADEKGKDIQEIVPEILKLGLDKMIYAERVFPRIKYISAGTNEMVLQDSILDRHMIIQKRGNDLYCDLHDSTDCEHIEFARIRGELGKMSGEWTEFR